MVDQSFLLQSLSILRFIVDITFIPFWCLPPPPIWSYLIFASFIEGGSFLRLTVSFQPEGKRKSGLQKRKLENKFKWKVMNLESWTQYWKCFIKNSAQQRDNCRRVPKSKKTAVSILGELINITEGLLTSRPRSWLGSPQIGLFMRVTTCLLIRLIMSSNFQNNKIQFTWISYRTIIKSICQNHHSTSNR